MEPKIALMFDFDLTLTPHYAEKPIFEEYGHDEEKFWEENWARIKEAREALSKEKAFPSKLQVPETQHNAGICVETFYTQTLLEHVRNGEFKSLSRKKLRELGKKIEFFPGMPECIAELKQFVKSKPEWKKHEIALEAYVISTAPADMIRGSAIGKHLDGIYACEFLPEPGADPAEGEIARLGFSVSYTEKTRFVYIIHKGQDIDVNAFIPEEHRRIPGSNMIYIGDGPSDVPPLATVADLGGQGIGVYSTQPLSFGPGKEDKPFKKTYQLQKQKRVFTFGPADYRPDSHIRRCLEERITIIANQIAESRKNVLTSVMMKPPSPTF